MNLTELQEIERKEAEEISQLNLKVLQKLDPEIEEIIFLTSFCSLHELDKASKVWHACETAGPLFLVKTANSSNMKMVLLNQKSPVDYEEDTYNGQRFELKESERFLFFQSKNRVIKGLWISNTDDLKKIYNLIRESTSE